VRTGRARTAAVTTCACRIPLDRPNPADRPAIVQDAVPRDQQPCQAGRRNGSGR
jgi:hypothetical protein